MPESTQVFHKQEIQNAIRQVDAETLINDMETGFAAYSRGDVVVPPVGHLEFEDPPGDMHIKYGYIRGDDDYVIKIASGFYNNPKIGLPSSNGLMQVFDQKNGLLKGILLDEGWLTDLRTALAGAVAAKWLAPNKVKHIGIVGTGIQARMQLEWLRHVTDCKKIIVWGRGTRQLDKYTSDMFAIDPDLEIKTTQNLQDVPAAANLIVTATPSQEPLLHFDWIRPGTHITALGSDTPGKQELSANLTGHADLVVADSLAQCREYGELHYAIEAGLVEHNSDRVQELGAFIDRKGKRPGEDTITVADLTGVAVQDIQISKRAFELLSY